ncbi:MAG: hypothetical protein ACI4MJ_09385 [Aristaeellaceae bacterium]
MQVVWMALAAGAAAGLWVLLREYRERQRQRQLLGYFRQSDLYAHLYPMIRKMEKMYVESVAIRREEVRIRTFKPAGKVYRFTYEKHGFDPVEDDRLFALAQAVGIDTPILRDRRRYDFVVHADERGQGGKPAWYEYMIRPEYKDEMLRADYLYKH